MFMGTSPTSSINSVPLSASSKRPILRVTAPVNAPFSWPKNSFSKSVSETEAGCTATKGPLPPPFRWMKLAMTSLPTPVSPSRSTGASVAATTRARSRQCRNAALRPHTSSLPSSVRSFTA